MEMFSNNRKIQRVPDLLIAEEEEKNKNKNDYHPKVVSIGPYHHGKRELAKVEAFKPIAVNLFVRSPEEEDYFYQKVLDMMGEVRNCYEESVAYLSDSDLALMMLRDASLIIIQIELALEILEILESIPKERAMIEHLGLLTIMTLTPDFFLVENQIPLSVIELLIRLRHGEGREREMIYTYASLSIDGEKYRSGVISSVAEAAPPLHLVEVMHRVLASDCTQPEEKTCNGCFSLFPSRNEATENWLKKLTHSFCTVTDLKAKGIHFRPSASQSLTDVNFKSGFFYATLQLPEWFVTCHTKSFFKNMVAYEMLLGIHTVPVVAEYIGLMQSLIESREDVKELRERRILYHQLGSDEEILNVYKGINSYIGNSGGLFFQVRDRIQTHYNSRIKTWIAELIHTHFRSPWTAIAFLAAAAIIALTAAQLHYAAHPL